MRFDGNSGAVGVGAGSWLNRSVAAGGTFAAPSVFSDAVSLWKLDEASGTRADSIGSNDLTDNNTVLYQNLGPSGTIANGLAASSEYLSHDSIDPSSGSFTMAMWVWGDSARQVRIATTALGATYSVQAQVTGNEFYCNFFDSSAGLSQPVISVPSSSTDTARFMVLGYNAATKKGFVSVNGSAKTEGAALTNGLRSASFFSVGADGGGNSNFKTGRFGYWSVVLDDSLIASLYNSGKGKSYADLTAADKVDLVSYWNLDEASGNRADSHGSNTLTDNNTVGSATNSYPANLPGRVASFVAANSEYLSRASQVIPSDSDFTVAGWLRVAEAETATGMLAWKTSSGTADQSGIFFEPENGSNHRFYNRRGYGSAVDIGDSRGRWLMFVYEYVHATTTHRVAVYGAAANDGVFSSGSVAAAGNNSGFYLGGPDAGIYMNGLMSVHAVWDRVLTSDERAALYNSGDGAVLP